MEVTFFYFGVGYLSNYMYFKGIVHPKKKIVIIYSPSSCSKPVQYEFLSSAEHKRRCGNQQLMDPIDFHMVIKINYGSQWGPSTVWLLTFFKISYFVLSRRKKFIQVWSKL